MSQPIDTAAIREKWPTAKAPHMTSIDWLNSLDVHALADALDSARAEVERLRRFRMEADCCYTMGDVADVGGSHCPLDRPCLKCQADRLRTVNTELVAALERVATHQEEIGGSLAKLSTTARIASAALTIARNTGG